VYRGEDVVYRFLASLQYHEKFTRAELADKKPIVMTTEDWSKFKNATECHICRESLVKTGFRDEFDVYDPNTGKYCGQSHKRCYYVLRGFVGPRRERKPKGPDNEACIFCGKLLLVNNYRDAMKDHCHITAKYRAAAHNDCNLKLCIKPQMVLIPVIFHNLKGYDGYLLMQAISRVIGQINCILKNMEKYVYFSLGNLRFINSLNFMMSSLDERVDGNAPEDMKIMEKLCQDREKRKMILKKGIYPYEYMDSFERFTKKELPPQEEFFSKLKGEGITAKEYAHVKEVLAAFGCQMLGDYHDLYVKTDVVLLADIFENFCKVCTEKYGLDPAHYYTAPGLSWDGLLKKTSVELELLTDLDMHLFIEKGMRGGISIASKQYVKANNPRVPDYD